MIDHRLMCPSTIIYNNQHYHFYRRLIKSFVYTQINSLLKYTLKHDIYLQKQTLNGCKITYGINLVRNPRRNILLSEFRIQNQRFQNSSSKVSEFKIKGFRIQNQEFRIQIRDTSHPAVPFTCIYYIK